MSYQKKESEKKKEKRNFHFRSGKTVGKWQCLLQIILVFAANRSELVSGFSNKKGFKPLTLGAKRKRQKVLLCKSVLPSGKQRERQ
jgi:hypothetical protein